MNTRYRINSVFSTDDAYVISGSEDQQIYFWDLVEGKIAHKLSGHTGPVTCVDYHPTEVCLLSSATDGVIKVWKNA
jgi:mitogen-activated protein kinase organizer 1